jgi:hypothetical protein
MRILSLNPVLANVQKPDTDNLRTLAVAASLIELFAIRSHLEPPSWTPEIGAIDKPYLLQSDAITSKWFRERCLQESPEPLRKRNIFATGNFLLTV